MYKTKIFKIGVVTMKEKELIDIWKREESVAHIHGWDFSHIEGRYTEETDLPWNYQNIILDYLKPEMKLLDIDTGGGEFLFLHRPHLFCIVTKIGRFSLITQISLKEFINYF